MSRKKAWRLDPKDVSSGGHGHATSVSPKGRRAATTWANQVRTHVVTLLHVPTEVRVEGRIGPACLSKAQWGVERDKLRDRLMKELEVKVARHLRIPGW